LRELTFLMIIWQIFLIYNFHHSLKILQQYDLHITDKNKL
jgi:TRAP-type C4-dicarboxylate transport system permease small subunit